MIPARTGKGQYSEKQVADALGLSVEDLRALIRSHISDRDEDVENMAAASFYPSDVLLLRILAGSAPGNSGR